MFFSQKIPCLIIVLCTFRDWHLEIPTVFFIFNWHMDQVERNHVLRHGETIRIHNEYEDGIEKSVQRVADWHHEACRVMTNGDRERRIFLSHPHTNSGFFFLLTTNYSILLWKNRKKGFQKIPNSLATWWRYFIITITPGNDARLACGRRAAVRFLNFPTGGYGYVGKNNGNPDLVCEKLTSLLSKKRQVT